MKRKHILTFGGLGLILVLLGLFLVLLPDAKEATPRGQTQTIPFESAEVGLMVERDPALAEEVTTSQEKQSGQLWKLTQPSNSTPFKVSAHFEQGESLKKLTALSKKPLKDAVLENVEKQLRQQYPSYKDVSKKDTSINGITATELTFTYVSKEVQVTQKLVLLFKNSEMVVYLRAQAKASDFTQIDEKYFKPLFNSARFK